MAISPWAVVRNSTQLDAPPPDSGPWAPVDTPPALQTPQPRVTEDPIAQNIEQDQQALQKVRWNQAHGWGTPENHPGKIGKLAHIFSQAGQIAGNIVAPNVVEGIQGSQSNMANKEAGLTTRLNKELEQSNQEQERDAVTRHTNEETSEAPLKGEDTHTLAGLQGKNITSEIGARDVENTGTTPDLATYRSLVKMGMPASKALQEIERDKALALKPSGMEKGSVVGPGGKPIEANYHPQTGKWTDTTGKEIINPVPYEKPNQAGMVTMIVPDPNNPGGGIVQRLGAGSKVAPGAQTAAGVNSMNTPTTNQRTAAGRADTVLQMVPEVTARLDAMRGQVGPEMGRWNEFMQGKVGTNNPEFAALRSDLLMMSSAVALAHAQGRLPENLREEFDHAINAPQQTPENLKATINAMVPWLQKVQQQGQGPEGRAAGAATPAASEPKVLKFNQATGRLE